MRRAPSRILVYLNWPETCFRASRLDLAALRALVGPRPEIVSVKSDRAFLRELKAATHVLTWHFKPDWFARAPKLRVIGTPAAGREFVPERGPKGVTIHFGHFHGAIMAENVAAFVLGWARGFFSPVRTSSAWPRTPMSDVCYEVAGTRAVIVGYGHVGRAIGSKLESLGVSVTGLTRHQGDLAVLASADWLVLALPSTTGTDDWLDAEKLRRLPARAVVINVGRGNSIDEHALFAALKAGRLAGAYLDVRKHEPSATVLESPGFDPRLARLPNVVVTPHSSAFSSNYIVRCFKELKDDGCL